jgi:ABC-type transport system substrate-binding protein
MPGHTEGIALPYDPAKARRLLAQAGYPDGRGFPVIKVRFAFNPEYNEILQTQWRNNLGIEIRWIDLPFDQYREQRKDLHAWIITFWADYPDPESFLGGTLPDSTGWLHEKYKELINRASEMMDYQERLKLYQQAERILIEEVPLLPVGYPRWDNLVKPWVRRLPFSPTRGWHWKEIILESWEAEQENQKDRGK